MVIKKKICNSCNKETYIYKNVKGEKYCKSCYYKLNPPKRIKPASTKKKEQDGEYSKLRKLFLDAHPFCKANLPSCTKISTDVHHMEGRGENYLKTESWMSLCRSCHNWITEHSKEAIELGFSKSRIKKL